MIELLNPASEITVESALWRLLLSFAVGFIVGWERGRHRQLFSIRPHVLIAVGSTLLMMLSIYVPQAYSNGGSIDPGRIAAQVVAGIGFLGAGAIIHMGVNIKGLTTAATIWVMAAIGLGIGAGMYVPAGIAAAIVLLVLVIVDALEKKLFKESIFKALILEFEGLNAPVNKIKPLLKSYNIKLLTINSKKLYMDMNSRLVFQILIPVDAEIEELFADIQHLFPEKSLKSISLSNIK